MRGKLVAWLSSGTAILLLAVAARAAPDADKPAPVPLDPAAITVVDGDSILLDGQEWRLVGFDTPETTRATCEGERRAGIFAQRRLAELLGAGRPIVLHPTGGRDRHKRPLGRLEVGGEDVGAILVAEGYARPYNGGRRKGWCSRDSRDDLVPGPMPVGKRR